MCGARRARYHPQPQRPSSSPIRVEFIEDRSLLEPVLSGWERLAVDAAAPYCSPAWMLSWWRWLRPPGARLRVGVAWEGEEVVGLAPFFAERWAGSLERFRLLGAGTPGRPDLLTAAGKEREVSEAWASAMSTLPRPPHAICFEGVSCRSSWAELLRDAWPSSSSPYLHRMDWRLLPAPFVILGGEDYDDWLQAKGGHFRRRTGRLRRQFEEQGAVFRLVESPEEIEASLNAFAMLHYKRWELCGGSDAMNARMQQMLEEVARKLLPQGRFRLWSLVLDGVTISSLVGISAGTQVAYWAAGFDPAWASQSPGMAVLMAALEHGWEVGDRKVDLGGGAQPYKHHLANGEDVLEWVTLVPSGPRRLLSRSLMLLPRFSWEVSRRLPEPLTVPLRAMLRRAGEVADGDG